MFWSFILCEGVIENGDVLSLSSLKMCTKQKWAAVKLLFCWQWEWRGSWGGEISMSLRMNTSKWPLLPWSLFPLAGGKKPVKAVCWRVRSAWSVVSKHQRFITKTNLWCCLISAMVRGRGEAYRDTLWCWRFYLQKEFIACFLSLPLIVLVCESMTRRLAEG